MNYTPDSNFYRQALRLKSGEPLWKAYDPRSVGMPSKLRYDLSGYGNHYSRKVVYDGPTPSVVTVYKDVSGTALPKWLLPAVAATAVVWFIYRR